MNTPSNTSRAESPRQKLERFLAPYQNSSGGYSGLRYHRLVRSSYDPASLWIPRFHWQPRPDLRAQLRFGLLAGFRNGEADVAEGLLQWLFSLNRFPDRYRDSDFSAYPVSDPALVFGPGQEHDEAPPHLLAEIGHHTRRAPLYLIDRELGVKEFHLVIAIVRGAPARRNWRALFTGPEWLGSIVGDSVQAARTAAGQLDPEPLVALGDDPLAGFTRRIEGRRVHPLEVIFETPAHWVHDEPGKNALRAALHHLIESYRAAWTQSVDI